MFEVSVMPVQAYRGLRTSLKFNPTHLSPGTFSNLCPGGESLHQEITYYDSLQYISLIINILVKK
jgi:hypothetical protein